MTNETKMVVRFGDGRLTVRRSDAVAGMVFIIMDNGDDIYLTAAQARELSACLNVAANQSEEEEE